MHSLTIVFGQNHSVVWTMMFRSAEKAEAARAFAVDRQHDDPSGLGEILEGPMLDITDDFGQRVTMLQSEIIAVMLEDMTQSKLCHVERAMHHAHIQAESQQRYEADPKLRIARSMQGPSMISPMNNGRM